MTRVRRPAMVAVIGLMVVSCGRATTDGAKLAPALSERPTTTVAAEPSPPVASPGEHRFACAELAGSGLFDDPYLVPAGTGARVGIQGCSGFAPTGRQYAYFLLELPSDAPISATIRVAHAVTDGFAAENVLVVDDPRAAGDEARGVRQVAGVVTQRILAVVDIPPRSGPVYVRVERTRGQGNSSDYDLVVDLT